MVHFNGNSPQTGGPQNQAEFTQKLENKGISPENIGALISLFSRNALNSLDISVLSSRSLNRIATDRKINALLTPFLGNQEKDTSVEKHAAVASPQAIKEATNEVMKLSEKDGHIWQCTGFETNKGGGEIFVFTPYDKYNSLKVGYESATRNFDVKESEIYPAVEPPLEVVSQVLSIDEEYEAFDDNGKDYHTYYQEHVQGGGPNAQVSEEEAKENFKTQVSLIPFFNALGISFEIIEGKPILKLPDAEALRVNLKKLKECNDLENLEIKTVEGFDSNAARDNLRELKKRLMERNQDLENFKIKAGVGIEGDLDFVEAFASENDCVLSSGEEFVHDFTIHLIPALKELWRGNIEKKREKLKKLVNSPLKMIKFNKERFEKKLIQEISEDELKLMAFFLGYWTDIISTWDFADVSGDEPNFVSDTKEYLYASGPHGYRNPIRKIWDRREGSLQCPSADGFSSIFYKMKANYEKE